MRITRAEAARLGLDYAALLDLARSRGRSAPAVVLPGEPRLAEVRRGDGWWEAEFWGWRPASKGEKARGWWAWHRCRRIDDAAVALWAEHPDAPPKATGKRRASLLVRRKRAVGRLVDAINLVESLADSLTANGLLRDDSGRWLEMAEPRVVADAGIDAAVETTIRLEDIG